MATITKSDWLQAALERLESGGVGSVSVVKLAQELSVTRGSFYWHFSDRQELLDGMLEYWSEQMTEVAIRHVDSLESSPRTKLDVMLGLIVNDNLVRYDAAVRAWALYDERARRTLRRVDRRRLDYMGGMIEALGFSPEEAAVRARLMILYLIGEPIVAVKESPEVRRRRMKKRFRLLLGRSGK